MAAGELFQVRCVQTLASSRKSFQVLDQHGNKCFKATPAETDRLLSEGLAVQHYDRRGRAKRMIRLIRSVAVVFGGEPPASRLLAQGWMTRQRYVRKEIVRIEQHGRSFPVWVPVLPPGYDSMPIQVPVAV